MADNTCRAGALLPKTGDLESCLHQVEQKTGLPHKIVYKDTQASIERFGECKAGVMFDSYFGNNMSDAYSCAAALKRTTKDKHFEVRQSGLLGGNFGVFEISAFSAWFNGLHGR